MAVMKILMDGQEVELAGFVPPTTLAVRVVSGVEFLALFTPAEVAGVIAADPRLLAGAFKALTQASVNLDSAELAGLLALAVSKGVLTQQRVNAIKAGQAP
jgi:hypothetical protein